jgi:DNA anti-recombination protein RmuC
MDPASLPLWIAVIGALVALTTGTVAPVLLAYLSAKQQREHARQQAEVARQQRFDDYARQDAVAARLEQTALIAKEQAERTASAVTQVVAQGEDAAKALRENKTQLAMVANTTDKKLDVIHVLVNSSMTEALQNEHDAVVRERALIQEMIELKKKMGHEPSKETIETLGVITNKIADLKEALDIRKTAQARINKGAL